MTPPSSHIIAPDRLLSVQEAGAAVLSPLSHYSYITVTNAYKDQDNTLNTHEDKKKGGGGLKRGRSEERCGENERHRGVKKREVVSEGGVNEASAFQ